MSTYIDNTKLYIKYAQDVVSGRIIAGKYIKLSCQRYLDWFERDDVYFDYKDIDKKIKFIQKLKLREGGNFILLPFQAYIISGIFGWKYVGEDNLRVINNVFILTARKSGKSTFAAAIALVAAICDGEKYPEIAFIANSAKQAGMLFKYTSELANSVDPQKKIFKRMRSEIRIPLVNGKIDVLSSDTSRLDGRSDSLFIQDEGHESRTFEIWNVLKTGQGARRNPLAISISTAGFNIGSTYPLYSQWEYCCALLCGEYDDDTWAPFIFQLDEGDDWTDENMWIKVLPSLGSTVSYKYMRDQIRTAQNTPSNEVSIKTKNLNLWCQSSDTWITEASMDKVMQKIDLSQLEGEYCTMGVDLSAVSDLTSFTLMFAPNENRTYYPDKFIFKTFVFIPEEAIENSVNSEYYKTWIRNKAAFKTSGNVVDYDEILRVMKEESRDSYLLGVYYDQFNATQWAINATEEGLPLEPYSQSLGNFNKPTKFLEMLIKSEKCIIDKNACVRWCFSNVELKYDYNDNCKPVKSQGDKAKKIDPVISIIESLGGWLNSPNFAPEVISI